MCHKHDTRRRLTLIVLFLWPKQGGIGAGADADTKPTIAKSLPWFMSEFSVITNSHRWYVETRTEKMRTFSVQGKTTTGSICFQIVKDADLWNPIWPVCLSTAYIVYPAPSNWTLQLVEVCNWFRFISGTAHRPRPQNNKSLIVFFGIPFSWEHKRSFWLFANFLPKDVHFNEKP